MRSPSVPPKGLYTDLYELRMVSSYLRRGMTADATFSVYVRPSRERPWLVTFGISQLLDVIDAFTYGDEEIAYLATLGIDETTLDWLRTFEPHGELVAPDEGTVIAPDEPLLELTAPLPVAQLLETAVINAIQYPVLIATKAARCALAAQGRSVIDFGFRRAHGLETGVVAALAAYVGGGLSTSNVEAGRRYGLPVVGTMAHSYVQAFPTELEAFRAYASDHPEGCVLLVDTYDTIAGVENAIRVAKEMAERGNELRGIRLDSGDLDALAKRARAMLDDAGLRDVRIIASGGLDEFGIAQLVASDAPIDVFGVGTDLVVSADKPALDIVYKLVAYDGRPVSKRSPGKRTLPGAKQIFRTSDGDVLGLREEELDGERLLQPVWRDGRRLRPLDIEAARSRAAEEIMRAEAMPALRTSEALEALTATDERVTAEGVMDSP